MLTPGGATGQDLDVEPFFRRLERRVAELEG
jgi:hypothetical protein